jgi:CDK inhibitor PHO81
MLSHHDGVCLDVAMGSIPGRATDLSVNDFADAVLRTIYHTLDGAGRRRIVLTSFSSDICAALNWKQPNCESTRPNVCAMAKHVVTDPVFFSSLCGSTSISPSPGAIFDDNRGSFTIAAAVDYVKSNNMLGVLLDAELLVCLHIYDS